jgi:hypothetical protein
MLKIMTPSGAACGSVLRIGNGSVTLKGPNEVTVRLDQITAMESVQSCDA